MAKLPYSYKQLHQSSPQEQKQSRLSDLKDYAIERLSLQHYLRRGHKQRVNAVAANDDIAAEEDKHYLASGSEDATVRVWYRDDKEHDGCLPTHSYRLFTTLEHDSGVSAVEFLQGTNTLLSGTHSGNLLLWSLDGKTSLRRMVSKGASEDAHRINTIASAPDGLNVWKVAVACSDENAHLLAVELDPGSEAWQMRNVHSMKHPGLGPVLGVDHIQGAFFADSDGDSDAAVFATCVASAVVLWTSGGDQIISLKVDHCCLTRLAVSQDGTLLFASGDQERRLPDDLGAPPVTYAALSEGLDEAQAQARWNELKKVDTPVINVWAMDAGHLVDKFGNPIPEGLVDGLIIEPLVSYDRKAHGLALNGTNVVTVREDGHCMMLDLKADVQTGPPKLQRSMSLTNLAESGHKPCVNAGPGKILVEKDGESILQVIRHDYFVTAIRAFSHEDEGAVLSSACENGGVFLWDITGEDAGECISMMRSLSLVELFGPLVDKILTFMQLSTFAFSGHVHWFPKVQKPAAAVHGVLCFNVHALLPHVDKAEIFWPKTVSVLVLMIVFIISALVGGIGLLKRLSYWIQGLKSYQNEKVSERKYGLAHMLLYAARALRNFWSLLIRWIASLLVVPIFKTVAVAFDCEKSGEKQVLHFAPSIECYEGSHLRLVAVLAPVLALFLPMLIPFVVVGGDASYVQVSEMFSVKAWKENAARKTGSLFLGPGHKNRDTVFHHSLLDLAAKVLIPILAIELMDNPILELSLIAGFLVMSAIALFVWPPAVDKRFSILVRSLKLLSSCIMLCGLYTAILQDTSRKEPSVCLVLSSILISLGAAYSIYGHRGTGVVSHATKRHSRDASFLSG